MYYATYMSLEYKRICGITDANLFSHVPDCTGYLNNMQELCNELKIAYINNQLDGYCLYVYGLVLKKLNHFDDAKDILIEAIDKETLNWAAWLELSSLIPEKNWVMVTKESKIIRLILCYYQCIASEIYVIQITFRLIR